MTEHYLQPAVLVSRFMLNLRQLNRTAGESNSDARHFSRFSASFRMPSDFLGNIGEPLDHSQSDLDQEDGSDTRYARARWDGSAEAGVTPMSHHSERANKEANFISSPGRGR